MKVQCFGIARDIVDSSQVEVSGSAVIKNVKDLRMWINRKYPAMAKLNGFMIAVNQEYANDDHMLIEEDEIAIIPPVSGG